MEGDAGDAVVTKRRLDAYKAMWKRLPCLSAPDPSLDLTKDQAMHRCVPNCGADYEAPMSGLATSRHERDWSKPNQYHVNYTP